MYKQIFANFSDTHLIVFGFILFMATFLGTLIWTLFIQEKSFYDRISLKPLDNGEDYGQ